MVSKIPFEFLKTSPCFPLYFDLLNKSQIFHDQFILPFISYLNNLTKEEKLILIETEEISQLVFNLNQPFIKDGDKKVQNVIDDLTLVIGEKITVRRFVRWEVGEGLEKRQDDFAAEVAAQAGGNA